MITQLSIIICTHNNAELLSECLNCIANQSLTPDQDFEVLVVDNHSKDNTKDVVEGYIASQSISKLRYVFEPNLGLGNARLTGVKAATHDWISFIDDDVRINENWIQSAFDFINTHPHAGVVGGKLNLKYVEEPSAVSLKCEAALCKVDYGSQAAKAHEAGSTIRLVGAAILFYKPALQQAGWMDKQFLTDRKGKQLASGGDTEMIFRVKNQGWEAWYAPSLEATHLIPPKRTTLSYQCQLHRGLARSSAQLRAIARQGDVPLGFQLHHLMIDIAFILRRAIAWAFHDLLRQRSIGDKRLVQVFEGLGRVESCIDFLFHPLKVE